ncbi:MAG: hypothetical protein U0W65_03275 [Bacteroidia bacterium]
MMKNINTLIATSILCTILFSACKPKEEIKPKEETPTPEAIAAINVLNTNSGYTTIFESAHSLGGVNNQNSIGINDFTLETNNRFNIAYYTEVGTQQSPLRTQYRYSKDIISNQFMPIPSGAGQYPYNLNINYDNVIYQYFPYSNMLAYSALKYSTGFGSNNGNTFGNDVSAAAVSPNPIGTPDFSFRYPVMNSGAGFGYFSKFASVNMYPVVGSNYQMFNGAIGSQANLSYYKGTIHEVYTNNGTYEFFAIGITSDSVKVYKFNYTSYGSNSTYPVYTTTLIKAIPTTISNYGSIIKHYSTDGNILSFMLTENGTNKVSSYIYNFQTNSLTQNLQQATLDYSGSGSDIDLDENGDVYYTGYAGNGSNTNGVSVYKKSSGGSILVGNDNILLYGTVVKLRILMNKIYLAVTGKQSGKDVYQISIIKQN